MTEPQIGSIRTICRGYREIGSSRSSSKSAVWNALTGWQTSPQIICSFSTFSTFSVEVELPKLSQTFLRTSSQKSSCCSCKKRNFSLRSVPLFAKILFQQIVLSLFSLNRAALRIFFIRLFQVKQRLFHRVKHRRLVSGQRPILKMTTSEFNIFSSISQFF